MQLIQFLLQKALAYTWTFLFVGLSPGFHFHSDCDLDRDFASFVFRHWLFDSFFSSSQSVASSFDHYSSLPRFDFFSRSYPPLSSVIHALYGQFLSAPFIKRSSVIRHSLRLFIGVQRSPPCQRAPGLITGLDHWKRKQRMIATCCSDWSICLALFKKRMHAFAIDVYGDFEEIMEISGRPLSRDY